MPLSDAKVLVVDDHDDLAEDLCEILRADGATVERAATGSDAVRMASRGFDVALVDIKLPDATGLSLLPRLKRAGDGFGQVLLITGNASMDDAIAAVQEDAYAYVLKPFDPASLVATVGRALAQVRLKRRAIALERRTRIAEKLAAVGTLAAGLAHEIRNPLNAASLQLQLLERRLGKRAEEMGDIDDLIEPAQVVQSEIARLSHLVEDFLAFSRPVDLASERLDLGELAHEVARLEAPDAAARGVELTAKIPDEPAIIEGDREKLLQVALNLVRNALEAIEAEGTIMLTVRKDKGTATLTIQDDGPGIKHELLSRIFEPFFSTKATGTGLGMPISHNIVTQHHGEMHVDSSSEGTSVGLEFPLAGA